MIITYNCKKYIALICCLVLLFTIVFQPKAHAEAITMTVLGAALFGVATYMGLNWIFSGATAGNASSTAISVIERYASRTGTNIQDAISGYVIRSAAGKMIIPAQVYNLLRNIIDDYVRTNNISTEPKNVINGFIYNSPVYYVQYIGSSFNESRINQIGENSGDVIISNIITGRNLSVSASYNNTSISSTASFILPSESAVVNNNKNLDAVFVRSALGITNDPSSVRIYVAYYQQNIDVTTGNVNYTTYTLLDGPVITGTASGSVDAKISDSYNIGDDLEVGQSWQGDFGEAADTNLDQLVGDIFSDVAVNDINVDGEVIEDQPIPTPRPTTPPATDVLGGINDLIEQQDQVLEGIDTITGEVSQTAEAAQEAAEAAQEAAEALQEGLDVVSAQDASTYKFDLSTLFPFCIPFDIVRMLQAFDGIAEAPHVQIPFVIKSMNFSYLIDLDFSSFSPVAAVLRQVELIAFGVALAYATSKVIRW